MNDSKEIIEAFDILNNILDNFLNSNTINQDEKLFLKQFKDWINIRKETQHNLFVFSLSEESSLLSQWRSYTTHGKGVSIGFSSDFLNAISKSNELRIAKCLYDEDEHKEILELLIDKLLKSFRQMNNSIDTLDVNPSQCYHPFLEKYKEEIFQVLSIIKNHAFREEREWRLISRYYADYITTKIKFREGASMLIPYIEISLGNSKPYFEKVILGPSPYQNLSMSALKMFLSNQQLCNTTVNCQIPYRKW